MRRTSALALLLIVAAPAWAAETEVSIAVLLGGGRHEEDAERAITEFKAHDAGKVLPAEGYPKVLSSEDLPGTPPDTYTAVLGYCPLATNKVVKRMIAAISTGAYAHAVPGTHEDSCPHLSPELLAQPEKKPVKLPAKTPPKSSAKKKSR